ncbi:MAG TPA: single-stranded DNA-binding protein [Edaphocola sp.]|nr:single-stranded DNA-binding protein [Edaphocola sp.]
MSNVKNSVQLIGHMGANPEIKTLENGAKIARLNLATTEYYKNKKGEWMSETTWHRIIAWEAMAEKAEKVLTKGSFVLIEGKLTNRSYTDAKGEKRYLYEVRANQILPLDKKEQASESYAPETTTEEDLGLPF